MRKTEEGAHKEKLLLTGVISPVSHPKNIIKLLVKFWSSPHTKVMVKHLSVYTGRLACACIHANTHTHTHQHASIQDTWFACTCSGLESKQTKQELRWALSSGFPPPFPEDAATSRNKRGGTRTRSARFPLKSSDRWGLGRNKTL